MATFDLHFALRQGAFAVDVQADVEARAVALVGPSGAGKTSVVEAIAGLRPPQAGRIAVNGRVLFDRAAGVDVPARLRRIGYVPQDVLLFPHLDVRRNVTYAPGHGGPADLDRLVDLLELTTLMDRRVVSLSGGERQRVALARALYSGPDVLLLDEPLAAVDLARRARIIEALLRIRDDLRVPLVYVTHSPDEARAIADVALALDEGRVVAAGSPSDVLGR
ncbi:MAG TPA: ATP-binding cassette domain-containing protein [Vicinamibacterales bacterium]|nr:ATP-binding cassette domain-containing protein [Vicinamibacterales bacterium]